MWILEIYQGKDKYFEQKCNKLEDALMRIGLMYDTAPHPKFAVYLVHRQKEE